MGRSPKFSIEQIVVLFGLLLFVLAFVSCGGVTDNKAMNVLEEDLRTVSSVTVFFGHQSVGYNILDGIKDIYDGSDGVRINISETYSIEEAAKPVFAHGRIGKNGDPIGKIDAFTEYVEGGIGDEAQITFMKFCYVDFGPDTDYEALFQHYRNTMTRLREQFPKTTFIHLTVPLVTRETGIKATAKKLLGRSLSGTEDNLVRMRYNDELKKEYQGKEPVFDIAGIESTFPNGERNVFSLDGEKYYALIPEYTTDGGHLNEKGRRVVAARLVQLLATVIL